MSSHVEKHLPLITLWIEFQLVFSNPLPAITPSVNFNYIIQRQQHCDSAPVTSMVKGPTANLQPDLSEPPMDPIVAMATTPAATDTVVPASVVDPAAVLLSNGQVAIPVTVLSPAMSIPKLYEQPSREPGRPGMYQYHALRAMVKYGFLKSYPVCWPVRALLKCYLNQESYNYCHHGAWTTGDPQRWEIEGLL
ncbi:hypothetical protein ARMGADRAFT_1029431 [Armillaria gallica]|uniref:Uncharacterized protein n=1 Tax=Armillaria gallica TaxID=47427 RepID=A0A2H3DGD7_ARMGA|nr:hypothetical protein ARMGADRAFT_1029431 [Armillaria gallica]